MAFRSGLKILSNIKKNQSAISSCKIRSFSDERSPRERKVLSGIFKLEKSKTVTIEEENYDSSKILKFFGRNKSVIPETTTRTALSDKAELKTDFNKEVSGIARVRSDTIIPQNADETTKSSLFQNFTSKSTLIKPTIHEKDLVDINREIKSKFKGKNKVKKTKRSRRHLDTKFSSKSLNDCLYYQVDKFPTSTSYLKKNDELFKPQNRYYTNHYKFDKRHTRKSHGHRHYSSSVLKPDTPEFRKHMKNILQKIIKKTEKVYDTPALKRREDFIQKNSEYEDVLSPRKRDNFLKHVVSYYKAKHNYKQQEKKHNVFERTVVPVEFTDTFKKPTEVSSKQFLHTTSTRQIKEVKICPKPPDQMKPICGWQKKKERGKKAVTIANEGGKKKQEDNTDCVKSIGTTECLQTQVVAKKKGDCKKIVIKNCAKPVSHINCPIIEIEDVPPPKKILAPMPCFSECVTTIKKVSNCPECPKKIKTCEEKHTEPITCVPKITPKKKLPERRKVPPQVDWSELKQCKKTERCVIPPPLRADDLTTPKPPKELKPVLLCQIPPKRSFSTYDATKLKENIITRIKQRYENSELVTEVHVKPSNDVLNNHFVGHSRPKTTVKYVSPAKIIINKRRYSTSQFGTGEKIVNVKHEETINETPVRNYTSAATKQGNTIKVRYSSDNCNKNKDDYKKTCGNESDKLTCEKKDNSKKISCDTMTDKDNTGCEKTKFSCGSSKKEAEKDKCGEKEEEKSIICGRTTDEKVNKGCETGIEKSPWDPNKDDSGKKNDPCNKKQEDKPKSICDALKQKPRNQDPGAKKTEDKPKSDSYGKKSEDKPKPIPCKKPEEKPKSFCGSEKDKPKTEDPCGKKPEEKPKSVCGSQKDKPKTVDPCGKKPEEKPKSVCGSQKDKPKTEDPCGKKTEEKPKSVSGSQKDTPKIDKSNDKPKSICDALKPKSRRDDSYVKKTEDKPKSDPCAKKPEEKSKPVSSSGKEKQKTEDSYAKKTSSEKGSCIKMPEDTKKMEDPCGNKSTSGGSNQPNICGRAPDEKVNKGCARGMEKSPWDTNPDDSFAKKQEDLCKKKQEEPCKKRAEDPCKTKAEDKSKSSCDSVKPKTDCCKKSGENQNKPKICDNSSSGSKSGPEIHKGACGKTPDGSKKCEKGESPAQNKEDPNKKCTPCTGKDSGEKSSSDKMVGEKDAAGKKSGNILAPGCEAPARKDCSIEKEYIECCKQTAPYPSYSECIDKLKPKVANECTLCPVADETYIKKDNTREYSTQSLYKRPVVVSSKILKKNYCTVSNSKKGYILNRKMSSFSKIHLVSSKSIQKHKVKIGSSENRLKNYSKSAENIKPGTIEHCDKLEKKTDDVSTNTGGFVDIIQRIINYFKARPNCPTPEDYKRQELVMKAHKAAKAAGLQLCVPKSKDEEQCTGVDANRNADDSCKIENKLAACLSKCEEQNDICGEKKKTVICGETKKTDVCAEEKKNELCLEENKKDICDNQKKQEVLCGAKKKQEVLCGAKKKQELLCGAKKKETTKASDTVKRITLPGCHQPCRTDCYDEIFDDSEKCSTLKSPYPAFSEMKPVQINKPKNTECDIVFENVKEQKDKLSQIAVCDDGRKPLTITCNDSKNFMSGLNKSHNNFELGPEPVSTPFIGCNAIPDLKPKEKTNAFEYPNKNIEKNNKNDGAKCTEDVVKEVRTVEKYSITKKMNEKSKYEVETYDEVMKKIKKCKCVDDEGVTKKVITGAKKDSCDEIMPGNTSFKKNMHSICYPAYKNVKRAHQIRSTHNTRSLHHVRSVHQKVSETQAHSKSKTKDGNKKKCNSSNTNVKKIYSITVERGELNEKGQAIFDN